MYNFIDTTEHQSSVDLPSEALSINGIYIENVIEGYRTLQVTGRELLGTEIDSLKIGRSDGERYQGKRYPSRTITVMFQLIAAGNDVFRTSFEKLNGILNIEEAQLIFNDETDKYFMGTPAEVGDINPGSNAVVGEFDIFCADPFKYSMEALSIDMNRITSKTITVGGNHIAPCIIEITPTGDIIDYTITGAARNKITGTAEPIKLTNLKTGKKVIINGEDGTILQDGQNKYGESDFWEFPTLAPGRNTITVSNALCNVTIKYKPRYL